MIFRLCFVAVAAVALGACGNGSGADSQAAAPQADNPAPSDNPAPAPAPAASPEPATAEPAAEFAGLPAPYNAADFARGQRTFRLCSSCHLLEEGAGDLIGPNLHGMFGRQVGAVEGFNYSSAVAEADFVWTPEILDEWLANPRDFLPGNRMSFAGVRRPDDRVAVIAYIMAETGWTPESAGE